MANEAKQFTINGVTHDVMDVGARQLIADLQTAIDVITSGDTTTAIKTFQEVIDFLDGVTDDATLIGKLNELRALIDGKQAALVSGTNIKTINGGTLLGEGNMTIDEVLFGKLENGEFYTGLWIMDRWSWTTAASRKDSVTLYIDVVAHQIYRWQDTFVPVLNLATVATSGSYNDLQDKPNIPEGVTVDQIITQNGTNPVQGGVIYSALEGKAGKMFIVNIEDDGNDGYTCDKTNAEIYAAWQAGRYLIAICYDRAYYLASTPAATNVDFITNYYDEENRIQHFNIYTTNGTQKVREYDITLLANIKTINGNTLLGDGNMTIDDVLVGKLENGEFYTGLWIMDRWSWTTAASRKDSVTLYVDVVAHQIYRWQDTFVPVLNLATVATSGSYNDLSDKPTIPTKTSDLTNDSGFLTQHQDISGKVDKVAGKGLSTNDYTTAEKQKLAGLSNYDDTAIQNAIAAKYTKPSTGIPASDIASGVIPDISGKANSADVYTKTEVDDKVADAGKVKSVTINGTNHTPNSSGVVDLGTIQGAKGDKGDKGDSGVSLGEAVVAQSTGSSTTDVMSQKAVTDAINYNVNIEHGTSVILPRSISLYTQLTQSQIDALNSSEVVTMLFKVKASDGGNGSQDWRYFEASPYTQTGFAFWTSFFGSIRLRSQGLNDNTVGLEKAAGITNDNLTPHPNICALVCDRVHGWVRFYRGKDLIVEDVQEYYKKSKFIDDDGLLCFCGGDYMTKLYAFQLYDFNAMPELITYDKNFLTVNGACDIPREMDVSYGESRAWTDVNHTLTRNYTALNITENNGVYTYTRKDGNAGDIYITSYSSQSFVTTKVDFTVDTDWSLVTYGNGWLEVYDKTTGTRLYTQTRGTIPAGSYIVYTFDKQGLFGLNTKSAGATVTVYEAKYRPSGIVANLRFDTLYNKNTFYDDVAGNFFQLFKDTQMTKLQSTFNLSNEQLNTIYSSGDLNVPHYVGEIKVVDGNIFIADATWTWKKINNT